MYFTNQNGTDRYFFGLMEYLRSEEDHQF